MDQDVGTLYKQIREQVTREFPDWTPDQLHLEAKIRTTQALLNPRLARLENRNRPENELGLNFRNYKKKIR